MALNLDNKISSNTSHHQDFPYQDQAGPSNHQDPSYQEPIYYHHPPLHMPGPGTGFSDGSQAGEEVPYQELPGQSYLHVPMPEQPGPSYCQHPEGFGDGSQAHDASSYGNNGSGMGGGFLNFLNAAEGFAIDDGFYFTSDGHIEFSHCGATQDTHPPNDQR
jgi:hypothetical protein